MKLQIRPASLLVKAASACAIVLISTPALAQTSGAYQAQYVDIGSAHPKTTAIGFKDKRLSLFGLVLGMPVEDVVESMTSQGFEETVKGSARRDFTLGEKGQPGFLEISVSFAGSAQQRAAYGGGVSSMTAMIGYQDIDRARAGERVLLDQAYSQQLAALESTLGGSDDCTTGQNCRSWQTDEGIPVERYIESLTYNTSPTQLRLTLNTSDREARLRDKRAEDDAFMGAINAFATQPAQGN